jgi:2-polyprenyl-6-methoxyphenol hydroxylase-like FAD-dependent oxidoreductase
MPAWDGACPNCSSKSATATTSYFDSVSRIRLDTWSHGRIVLVGDAASCVSLLGEGSSMAITAAATLAQALVTEPTDPARR